MIAATGEGSHTLARAALNIEFLEHRLRFFWRHARHVYSWQGRVERFLLCWLGPPHRDAKEQATGAKNEADADYERESRPPIDLLDARATPHFSLYSMRGARQSSENFLVAGNECAASGRFTAMNGPGRRA